MIEAALMNVFALSVLIVSPFIALVLWADRLLRRRIKHSITRAWTGYQCTARNGEILDMIAPRKWWLTVLPWPGKRKWTETVLAKAALLGATFEYQAVSAFDWDEAWVIELPGTDELIASSNKVATALAFLKHKGIDV